jgi:hypothetical protein
MQDGKRVPVTANSEKSNQSSNWSDIIVILVRSGFTMSDIYDMTLSQIKVFVQSVHKMNSLEFVNTANATRVGYHADQQSFKKITEKMTKGL